MTQAGRSPDPSPGNRRIVDGTSKGARRSVSRAAYWSWSGNCVGRLGPVHAGPVG
jgi:hypothetical protein